MALLVEKEEKEPPAQSIQRAVLLARTRLSKGTNAGNALHINALFLVFFNVMRFPNEIFRLLPWSGNEQQGGHY